MTTRRAFIAGLMTTAVAPALPADAPAARLFFGWDTASPLADRTAWYLVASPGTRLIRWSDTEDLTDWTPRT